MCTEVGLQRLLPRKHSGANGALDVALWRGSSEDQVRYRVSSGTSATKIRFFWCDWSVLLDLLLKWGRWQMAWGGKMDKRQERRRVRWWRLQVFGGVKRLVVAHVQIIVPLVILCKDPSPRRRRPNQWASVDIMEIHRHFKITAARTEVSLLFLINIVRNFSRSWIVTFFSNPFLS